MGMGIEWGYSGDKTSKSWSIPWKYVGIMGTLWQCASIIWTQHGNILSKIIGTSCGDGRLPTFSTWAPLKNGDWRSYVPFFWGPSNVEWNDQFLNQVWGVTKVQMFTQRSTVSILLDVYQLPVKFATVFPMIWNQSDSTVFPWSAS